MKTNSWMVSALVLLALSASAQVAEEKAEMAAPVIVERGPHHRTWERQTVRILPDGRSVTNRGGYTELATGLYYKNERGEWIESKEEIEIFQGAAVARQGQHSVIFAAQLNSPGAIDLLAPDGKRFRSHILGLAYTDASGRSVMIAETKDSIGMVLPPNQVIYQNAFSGDCVADVRFTYTKAGFDQDIILLTAPPSPAEWNMNPETTRLEVFTEFIEVPEGTATPVVLKQESDPVLRQEMAEPDLIDQRLDFGVMKMEQGQAFPLGDADPFGGASVPTGKSMERIDGRVFLIEKVDYRDIREHLKALPQQAANQQRKVFEPAKGRRMFAGLLPPAPRGERGAWKEKQYAKVDPGRKGLVLDYVALNSSQTNYVLKCDSTYYFTGTVNFYGTTVIEGGTVVKYTNYYPIVQGPVDCRTDAYRPAFFVSKNDDTVGEIIPGSTGNPSTNQYAVRRLDLSGNTNAMDLHDLRFRNGFHSIYLSSGGDVTVRNCQFSGCFAGVVSYATKVRLQNTLIHDGDYGIGGGSLTNIQGEQMTFHRLKYLISSGSIILTNALVIAVTNQNFYTGGNIVSNASDTGYFQTVGPAAHYLANSSTNRNAGTTNINPTLLAALKKKTTYPPVVLTNKISASTNFSPAVPRGTTYPDLGYAYDPLDYVAYGISISNATVTVSPGTVIGVYGGSGKHGLRMEDGSVFLVSGAPMNLCRVVRYNLVQEQATTNWSASTVGRSVVDAVWGGSPRPIARFRFTDWSSPAGGQEHFSGDYATGPDTAQFDFIHCQLRGGKITSLIANMTFTNCLFERTAILDLSTYSDYRNCLAFGGSFDVDGNYGTHTVADTFFDRASMDTNTWIGTVNHHNGYVTGETRLYPEGTNSVVVSNMVYQTGTLGFFYQPTNSPLINTGSVANAALAGLFHFTSTTNQLKETNSVVDISFHYMAVNPQDELLDSDGDGLSDATELLVSGTDPALVDSDGDGMPDGWEYLRGLLQCFNDANLDLDGDGISNLQEYLTGSDPASAPAFQVLLTTPRSSSLLP